MSYALQKTRKRITMARQESVDLLQIASGIIAVVGTITNSLSLYFFIKKTDTSLSSRIFTSLNAFDLSVCLFSVAVFSLRFCSGSLCGHERDGFLVSHHFMYLSVESTAFSTCLLSITRTISLWFPFYRIKKRAVRLAGIIFILQELARLLTSFYFSFVSRSKISYFANFGMINRRLLISLISAVVVVNLVSSVLSVWKLTRKDDNLQATGSGDKNRTPRLNAQQRATVTILIVSILFCIFNVSFCVSYCLRYFEDIRADDISGPIRLLYRFSIFLTIPLNSAMNPIIYFTRKEDMRKYIRELLTLVIIVN
jgi:hypothetical protein